MTLLWCEGLVTFTSLRFLSENDRFASFPTRNSHLTSVAGSRLRSILDPLGCKIASRMDLDANCSTLGANGALAEIVAKHVPEAYIGPTAHAVPPNLSQISWILLLVVVQPKAKCLSVQFASKIIITTPPTL